MSRLLPSLQGAPPSGATAKSTYLADSAKAWSGAAAAAPPVMEVRVKPGQQSYGFEELKGLRAESGIDMTQKEAYLSDDEFAKVFKKDRAEWAKLPAWRRTLLKKEQGLF